MEVAGLRIARAPCSPGSRPANKRARPGELVALLLLDLPRLPSAWAAEKERFERELGQFAVEGECPRCGRVLEKGQRQHLQVRSVAAGLGGITVAHDCAPASPRALGHHTNSVPCSADARFFGLDDSLPCTGRYALPRASACHWCSPWPIPCICTFAQSCTGAKLKREPRESGTVRQDALAVSAA